MILGIVTDFDTSQGWGTVLLVDGRELPFGTLAFRCGRPSRYAQAGDPVDVVMQDGRLVSVRLRK